MSILEKIRGNLVLIRYFIPNLWFNFHYLPFKQAIKLPIWLYKPKFIRCKGKVIIDSENITSGMIKLGKYKIATYPNGGIVFENNGGTIIFKGVCYIGANSTISVENNATLSFGDNFLVTSTFRIVSHYNIEFKENVRFAWECLVMDTDHHIIKNLNGKRSKGYGKITIGRNNWIGTRSTIYKNTQTPDYCIFSSGSSLNQRYDFPEYSLIGPTNNSLELRANGLYRDLEDDKIIYQFD